MKGRFVVLPKNTRNHHYYEIPSDLEIAHRPDSKTATSSTLSLVHSMIPSLKEKGVDVLSFAIPPAHSTHPLIQTDSEEIGLRMSSVDSSPLETNSENEGIALTDSKASLLFPSDHYFFGTDAEFQSLYKEFFLDHCVEFYRLKRCDMDVMIPIIPNYSLNGDDVVYYYDMGVLKAHPGTDGRETQWENETLPNYRLVSFLYPFSNLLEINMGLVYASDHLSDSQISDHVFLSSGLPVASDSARN